MIRLTKEQVLMFHIQLIESTGGCDGIRDEGLLDSALESPFNHLEVRNYIQAFRQKQQDYAMDLSKITR